MKTLINIIVGNFILILNLSAINVSVTTADFSNGNQSYIEIYSKFMLDEIQWATDSTNLEQVYSEIELLCVISQNESIVIAEKYSIQSPFMNEPQDFWDLKRFSLVPGEYDLDLQYVDLNNLTDTLNFSKRITIQFNSEEICFSDILLFSKVGSIEEEAAFSRNNFSYEPLEFNLIDPSVSNLIFYTELYNVDKLYDEQMFVKYFLVETDSENLQVNNKVGYKVIEPDSVNNILIDFPVDHCVSGNYMLHIELHEKNKKFVSSQNVRFSIYNPVADFKNQFHPDASFERCFFQFLTKDELDYSLKAIFPRVGNNMTELLNYIVSNDEMDPKKYFLYNFWSVFSIEEMKENYDAYMNVARAVDNTYHNNVGFGFETHRGYYFLKYGKPDDIIYEEDEQTAPPYEIWIYNYVEETQQTNVKFLFYNPSLATNDFILLHSTCRGERKNPRWELELYSDAYNELPNNYIDGRQMPDNFHRNARKYFSDF